MYRVDITADLNDEDETGYVWTFLDEARDPTQVRPGSIVIAGDEDAAAVCQVIDLVPAGDGTMPLYEAPARPSRGLPSTRRENTRELEIAPTVWECGVLSPNSRDHPTRLL